jgi:conjugal transfer pilus assembly protein TraW
MMQQFFKHRGHHQWILILVFGITFLTSIIANVIVFKKAEAKDFGVQGHTTTIQEEDLLELLLLKLKVLERNGILQQAQEGLKSKAISRIKNPPRVEGIEQVTRYNAFTVDPTMTVPADIKDHKGTLIHKAGTKVNPLHYMPFKQTWFFIEGDDARQVKWALNQVQKHQVKGNQIQGIEEASKIILVSGSPFDLSEQHGTRFYFDQLGKITSRMGIKRVPAKLRRDRRNKDVLLIEEIKIREI